MIAAIEGAQRQVLFETYIWKGDEVGVRFKDALTRAADRGVEVYCIYDGFANLVVSPSFKRFPPHLKVLKLPGLRRPGWRFFDLRRYGRDHRKILVVDDTVGVRGRLQHRLGLRDGVARHARAAHRAPACGT